MVRVTKDMGVNVEQVIAVRNYLRNHKPTNNEEILKHMPQSLEITEQVLKLSLALMYQGDI